MPDPSALADALREAELALRRAEIALRHALTPEREAVQRELVQAAVSIGRAKALTGVGA